MEIDETKLSQEMCQLIADVSGRNVAEITPEANFWDDLGIDSIKAIEITVALEKKYKIRVKDEEIQRIKTMKDAVSVVRDAVERKNAT